MSFKLFVIPAVIASVLYGFAMASIASAETVTVTVAAPNAQAECDLVDGMVECDVHSDLGINNVHVFMNSGIGAVTVLDQDFAGCPTDVQVILDPIVIDETSEMEVQTCGVVIPCDNCSAEICIDDSCKDLPDVGVGRPDPLPLKNPTATRSMPIILSSSDISPR